MAETKLFTPSSVQEALLLLLKHGAQSRVLAGGSDVLIPPEERPSLARYLVSLMGIPDLDYIREEKGGGLKIGALATLSSLEKSALVKAQWAVLAQAAGVLGTPALRNRATLGGNLCNAAPSADMAPALIVLGARVKIDSVDGSRVVPVEDFFRGPGQTVIKAGQLLTEIQIPPPLPNCGGAYLKHTRNRGADLALVGVAALVSLKKAVWQDVRLALGAVAPTPLRARKAEDILRGRQPGAGLIEKAAQVAVSETSCIDDIRCSAEYRRALVATLVKRALKEAQEKAQREISACL